MMLFISSGCRVAQTQRPSAGAEQVQSENRTQAVKAANSTSDQVESSSEKVILVEHATEFPPDDIAVVPGEHSGESPVRTASSIELKPETSEPIVPPIPATQQSSPEQAGSEFPLSLIAADSPPGVSFNQMMFAGLNSHPTIGATFEQIRQSQGDLLQASLLPNPTLFTDIQMLPFRRPFTENRQGGPPQQDVFLTYPIDWFLFGKRTAKIAATQYALNVSQANFQDMMRLRAEEVAASFYDVVRTQALEELAQANVENLESVETTTRRAVEVGKRPAVELNRVRLDVLSARQELRLARAASLSAQAALRSLTNWEDGSAELRVDWPLITPLITECLPIEQALEVAERTRPDLESLRWRVTQSGAEVVVEQRAARPQIAPSFGWTHQYQKEIAQPDADSWNANVTMSVPIFDRNQGNIAKAQAVQHQNQLQYQARLLSVRAEVRQAVADLHAAEDNAKAVADEQLQLASKVRDSIVEAYSLGGRPLIDVLDAQRNYRETFRLYITTRTAFWTALYRYRAAVGTPAIEHD